jgi:hypothetical protein
MRQSDDHLFLRQTFFSSSFGAGTTPPVIDIWAVSASVQSKREHDDLRIIVSFIFSPITKVDCFFHCHSKKKKLVVNRGSSGGCDLT